MGVGTGVQRTDKKLGKKEKFYLLLKFRRKEREREGGKDSRTSVGIIHRRGRKKLLWLFLWGFGK